MAELTNAEIDALVQELKKRLGLIKYFATLGDSDDLSAAIVDEPGRSGFVRVRLELDDVPFRTVKCGLLGAYSPFPGSPVIVGYDEKGDLAIEKADFDAIVEAKGNPLIYNSGDNRLTAFNQTDGLLPLSCGAVSSAAGTLTNEVFVNSFRFVDKTNTVQWFKGALVDLTALVPGANLHRYVALFLKDDLTIEIIGSTPIATITPLTESDKQECFDTRDVLSIPIALWRLHNSQTVVTNPDKIEDLRPWQQPPGGPGLNQAWNGTFTRNFDLFVTSDGATITGSLDATNGGNLKVKFSDSFPTLDTDPTPLTVTLTPGTDNVPQINHVYVLQSDSLLTAKTSTYLEDWPSAEHAPVAIVILRTAATTQTDGVLGNQNINNRPENDSHNNQGWIQIAGNRMRSRGPHWWTGVTPTITIVSNGGAPDDIYLANTSGIVQQFNMHTFPALDMQTGDDIHIVNRNGAAYTTTANLNTELSDRDGNSMSNKYFWLTFWGVINKTGEISHLMCNLPSGSYNTQANAEDDVSGTRVRDIPSTFHHTGFLIAETLFRHQPAASGTWTEIETNTLLGKTDGGGGGAIVTPITSFSDAVFDWFNSADPTKLVDVDLSGLTAATTRTLTMPDKSGTLAMLSDIVGGSGSLEFIEEKVLSADTSTTFSTGITGTDRYLLFYELDNATGTGNQISIRVNGDANESDYARQILNATGSTVSAVRAANTAAFALSNPNAQVVGYFSFGLVTDGGGTYKMVGYAFNARHDGNDTPLLQNRIVSKNSSISDITQIEILSSVASAMNGSIRLYRLLS